MKLNFAKLSQQHRSGLEPDPGTKGQQPKKQPSPPLEPKPETQPDPPQESKPEKSSDKTT